MDLHHTGSDNELVYIQSNSLSLTIKGASNHASMIGGRYTEKESALTLECEEDWEIELSGDAETDFLSYHPNVYKGQFRLIPLFFEQQNYELIIEPEKGHTVTFWHENINIRKKITQNGRKSYNLSGMINFGNEIGFSDFIIQLDGRDYLKLTIEVFPSKISYKKDYLALQSDIISEVYNLIFDFLKKTCSTFEVSTSQQSSPVEFFAIIQKIYRKFITSADMILRTPHHQLQTEHGVLSSHKIKCSGNKTMRWLEKHPDHIKRSDDLYKVDKALAVKKYVTYDTKENRLTKFMLIRTAQRLKAFKIQYQKLSRESDPEVLVEIDRMIDGINRRANIGFMKEVNAEAGKSGMSLVFGMAPGYRDLYRCYLLLRHGLTVSGEVFNLSVKDLALLYEYWCFIKLNSILKNKYELVSQNVISIDNRGLYVSLEKGRESRIVYRNPKNDERITLMYNTTKQNNPTGPQKPDNVLSLNKKGADTDYEYVFDAKYRINPALEGTPYYNISHHPGPQVDDINTMHRYRDAIVYQNNAASYERTMFGAYVLFPYHNEEEYIDHPFYKSIEKVNIGGLPFLPSATSLVVNMLDELITDTPESAFERATLPKGIESRLKQSNWTNRDVLVGSVNNKEDLNSFIKNSFYCIKASRITDKDLPIHYVALYQTKEGFGPESKIEYYGEVIETALKQSGENTINLKEKGIDYYFFKIRKWNKLSRPIEPKERGFDRIFTTMFLLKHSSKLMELLLKSEEEYRFYTELKRRTEAAFINNEKSSGFEFGDNKILFEDGQIFLFNKDQIKEQCTIIDFARTPNATFRRLMRYLDETNE